MKGKDFLGEMDRKLVAGPRTLTDLFRLQVKNSPLQQAVKEGIHGYTYEQLESLSNKISCFLQDPEFTHQALIPVSMGRSYRYIATILGILKSGKAFVPLNPDWPEQRKRTILKQLGSEVLLTDGKEVHLRSDDSQISVYSYEKTLEIENEELLPFPQVNQESLAYIIFTSGSTGEPKGVMVSQRQLFNATQSRIDHYACIPHLLLIPPLTFDASLAAIFWPLCTGGSLVISSISSIQDVDLLPGLLQGTDTLLCVPAFYRFLLDLDVFQGHHFERVILGGESLPEDLAASHFGTMKEVRLYNEYGPTEATIWSTVEEVKPDQGPITIGMPVSGVRCYVLDQDKNMLPKGAPGELFIGGGQVSQGYWKDPGLTAARFLPDPFSKEKGAKMYATGDQVRLLPDGSFVFEGRKDRQIKFQGNRIDLSEIEKALSDTGEVKEAIALLSKPTGAPDQIVLFVVPKGKLNPDTCKQRLVQRLPAYMLPGEIQIRDRFPLTENGKVDQAALLAGMAADRNKRGSKTFAPELQYLKDAFEHVLGVNAIDPLRSFFEIGGNSLAAMRLAAHLNKEHGYKISVADIFEYPTISDLHGFLQKSMAEEPEESVSTGTFSKEPVSAVSSAQKSLWLVDQLEGSLAYHLPVAYLLNGRLDPKVLEDAIRAVLKKHESLRTCISGIDQVTRKSEKDWSLVISEDSGKHFSIAHYQEKFVPFFQSPFDLKSDFMIRGMLVTDRKNTHALGLVFHHIAFDDYSMKVFLRELSDNYRQLLSGEKLDRELLSEDYLTLIRQQEDLINQPEFKTGMAYWKEALAGSETLKLPKENKKTSSPVREVGILRFEMDKDEIGPLVKLGEGNQATLFMTFLAVFKVLLYRYSNQRDISVGSPILNRDLPGSEEMIGYFINTLPLRSRINPEDAFSTFLQQIRKEVLMALKFSQIPLIKLVEAFASGDRDRKPFFNTLFVMHQGTADAGNLQIPGVEVRNLETDPLAAKYDLTLTLSGDANRLSGTLEYDRGLFSPETMLRMRDHFRRLVKVIPEQPQLPIKRQELLSRKEIEELSGRNNYNPEGSYRSFFDRYDEQVRKVGNSTALLVGKDSVDFRVLDQQANQIATWLKREGVNKGDHVILLVQRDQEMVAAMLGIWKVGAVYVPVDPAYPKERINFILADCGAKFLVSDEESVGITDLAGNNGKLLLIEEAYLENPTKNLEGIAFDPDQRAYVIYTSGSTGKPKGVALTHGNLAAFLDWCGREFKPESFGLMYAATSMCFDLSIFELFFPLAYGKPIRILQNGLQIPEYLPGDKDVLINTVPSLMQKLLEERVDLSSVSLLNMAGEPIPQQVLNMLDLEKISVRNLYGPTEDTTYSTCEKIQVGETLSIGRPIEGSYAYILNQDLQPCPVGVPGEIYLGGKGLAEGYLNRPGLTAEKFIPDPLETANGDLIYKTGDMGVWNGDGKIQFLGRLDNQVKFNGFRIELDEVASVLQSIEGVKNAVAVLQIGSSGEQVLTGFVTGDKPLDTKELIDQVRKVLPSYMVPSRLQFLEKFPLSPNGKVDRKQLERTAVSQIEEDDFEAPATLLESNLLDLWRKVLQSDTPGIKDDFFLSGGNSLLAIRLIGRIKESLEFEVSISELFARPTVSELAEFIKEKEHKEVENTRILPFRPRPDIIPLSFGQESLWLTDKLEGSNQYHIPLLLKLKGETRSDVLQEAIKSILERHEVLRTVIREQGEHTWQQVLPVLGWELLESAENPPSDPFRLPQEDMAEFLERPFDLGKDFMIRAKKYYLNPDECLLLVVVHHIAFDGWSIPVFIKELFALVKAEKTGESLFLPHLKIQYADYALWQRNRLSESALEKKLLYWKEKLKGVQALNLFGGGEHVHQRTHEGGTLDFFIDGKQRKDMLRLGKSLGLSPFMILLAVFKSLMERNSGQQDLCVGTAMGGRKQVEAEPLIGYFVNPLPIRSTVNPEESFKEILLEVKKNTLEAFDHQDVPFEKIVAATAQRRQFGVNPLFQVMFVMEYGNEDLNRAEGFSMEVMPFAQTSSKFDLTFLVKEESHGIRIRIEYSKDLFDAERIETMAKQYKQILGAGLANTGQKLSQLLPEQLFQGIGKIELLSAIRSRYAPIQQHIEAVVSRHGDKTAVFFGQQEMTFDELNIRANQLAGYLLERGLRKGQIVGIVLERSPEFLVSILGILKAGGAYLPIDTGYPDHRIDYMLDDSCTFFITGMDVIRKSKTQVEKIVWEDFLNKHKDFSSENPGIESVPEDPAYIIYTSGTTGRPKGVVLEHLNLFNFVSVVKEHPGISAKDKVLSISSVSFDIALLETLVSLAFGAQVVVVDKDQRKDPQFIINELEKREITIMFATPSHWKLLLEGGWNQSFDNLRMISGGEPLERKLADRLLPLCAELWNVYGPTETTVYATIKRVQNSEEEITVGKPVLNTQILIMDKFGNPVQKGRKGEIHIAGHGVGKGYLNQPELTKEKFTERRIGDEMPVRVYKSGDLGWINALDELVVSGRLDHQVKIRGYRIELAEVESVIRQLEGVTEAIVKVRKDEHGQGFLTAYLSLDQKVPSNIQEWQYPDADWVRAWKDQLAQTLSDYMIPTDFIWMKAFPLLENGKVNRNALPDPDRRKVPVSKMSEEVLDPEEKLVANIWKAALGLSSIHKKDNFFEIGGHSLTAVKVMVQLEKVYGIRLPLSVLFKYPTIQKLSQAIKSGVLGDSEWRSLVAIKKTGSKPPLYIVHGGGLNILPFYAVAREMDKEQPVFGIQAKGLDGVEQPLHTVEAIASQYLAEILQQNPDGPYFLAGYSLGGIIAFEMASQLKKMGKSVGKLVFFDTYAFQSDHHESLSIRFRNKIRHFLGKRKFDVELLIHHSSIFKRIKKASFEKKLNKIKQRFRPEPEKAESSLLKTYKRVEFVYKEACRDYKINYYDGTIDLIKAKIASGYLPDKEGFGWKPHARELRVWEAEGEHITMLSPPNDTSFARLLQHVLDQKNKK
ncbi:non-ribosomal peptide synthetase [Cyclobacterium jeungdonense]|uniref:Amino acid adenylation domain-containing protein n=1 Tax=Cyclobacterium jeungdonense TaxID=708087 RepID=A0ABT8CBV7_9BACT|nr:non-ribosomal peptide synthetase [Cyclobacterium jeungdonense]MDN3689562.1 amino acid adenylation domain-containing protein [Cyclobacterium jeungdonense]